MAAITAKAVAELRAKTNCGMMECKKALTEAEGNFDEAIKILREKGLATAAKKADRIAAEGVVDILREGKTAAMIEVNAETDFVAKNDTFVEFVKGLLRTIIANRPADVEALKALPFDGTSETVADALVAKIAVIKENISIRRFVIVDGQLNSYIHGHGTTGVIVKFDTDDATAATPEFAEMSKNVALQVAAMNCEFVNRDAVPAARLAEEKEIIATQIKNDPKNASKPDAIIEKMAVGKLGKFFEQVCLADQAYVKDDSMSVAKYVESVAKELGAKITLVDFCRYEKGEGLQKREDNFADEIASLVK
ncbi:MAG: translation elongation factor Ts [Firmicutes bacterium]|uniref:Elongation factor Ts n=1 Tax=Candidatus Colimorpha enterica TaxID=3083063 RepID=R6TQW7_9BACT|nr:elongation factor Ts [Candidatus Colimorpha enterica]MCI5755384.1 translation elongation factor Ts [Candidatus Colimorpha enterica]MDD6321314.1 translation elongation factor Ts [Bacillota bacterium]MDY2906134.1 translation elongation factor Ts [Eubacteriales bacterium]CDC75848.1 elongation factor Ts [Candidatus Colimorpha enterica]